MQSYSRLRSGPLSGRFTKIAAMTGSRPGSSGLIEPGKDYTFTFNEPGQFTYRCGVHPTMLGVIVVREP